MQTPSGKLVANISTNLPQNQFDAIKYVNQISSNHKWIAHHHFMECIAQKSLRFSLGQAATSSSKPSKTMVDHLLAREGHSLPFFLFQILSLTLSPSNKIAREKYHIFLPSFHLETDECHFPLGLVSAIQVETTFCPKIRIYIFYALGRLTKHYLSVSEVVRPRGDKLLKYRLQMLRLVIKSYLPSTK